MTEPSIAYGKDGHAISFNGREAVDVYRAAVLKSALGLLQKGICPTRGLTLTKALKLCREYTGRDYKRSEVEQAKADLQVWIATMRSTIPEEVRS